MKKFKLMDDVIVASEDTDMYSVFLNGEPSNSDEQQSKLKELGLLTNDGEVIIKANTPIINCDMFGGGGGNCNVMFDVGNNNVVDCDLCVKFEYNNDFIGIVTE